MEGEDNEFLNQVDIGYIGHTKPEVVYRSDPYADVPRWIIGKFTKQAKEEGLLLEEFMDKYNPSFDPDDWDNDPSGPDQAWA